MTRSGFEYKNKKNETPFETFLRYSDEKEKSADKLATVLRTKLNKSSRILDVGTGSGEYLKLALSKIDPKTVKEITLTLVEPSNDFTVQLTDKFANLLPAHKLKVVNSDLQNLKGDDQFDVILMSHLFYHIPRDLWTQELLKALSMLKKGGVLILVLREKDDAYDFKMELKSQLFDASYKALVLDDVLGALPKNEDLRIERLLSLSELHFPTETSPDDTVSIIEFYLNKEWSDIPSPIQRASLDYLRGKGGIFKQVDGIAVVSKQEAPINKEFL